MPKFQCTKTTSADSSFGTSPPSLSTFYFFFFFLHFLIISLFQEIIILVCSCFYLKNNPVFYFIWMNLHGRINFYCLMFFNNILKIILNVWDWIWSIRQVKFIIPSWSWNFKFIVVIYRFNIPPCVINA